MSIRYRSVLWIALASALALGGCDDGDGADAGPGTDAGSASDAGPPAASCSDGIQNQDESDTDCGGVCGATCTPGEMCRGTGDCTTSLCSGGTCDALPTCSDGVMNATETDVDCGGAMCLPCDDGDACLVDGDCTAMFCSAGTCTAPVCGNGVVEGSESCDDGLMGMPAESTLCDADCTAVQCGDGVLNTTAGEMCDGDAMGMGGETATCDTDCTPAVCGDGVINTTAGEACDGDGMGTGGESATCNTDCTAATCGDGIPNLMAGEQCDDGNMDDTDLCSNMCMANGPPLAITANATFDTDTGQLDGTVAPGWDATTSTLLLSQFSLARAATLTVTGSNPFRVMAATTINIAGTLDASGGDGGDGQCNVGPPGTAGAAGPAGFAGGAGGDGGSPPPSYDGSAGAGPGGGAPGRLDESGGGGAGHIEVGTAGVGTTAGAGGALYNAFSMNVGGSGGGGGSSDDDGGTDDDAGGGGGGGGGFVELSAGNRLTVTGSVDVSGGAGGLPGCAFSGAGGGGSGGVIVLDSGTLMTTTGTLNIAGGAGGVDATAGGGNGSVGLLYLVGTCTDGVRNQDETDLDCGGGCGPCGDGLMCAVSADCMGDCLGGTCYPATCANGMMDGTETAIDCGGGTCPACSCTDGILNQDETDVDCGGALCGACADGGACVATADCASMVCEANVCVSCSDGARNQDETDVDCGGATCGGCGDGLVCGVAGDCASMVCEASVCVSCADGARNQDETDVDCGGTTCGACVPGQTCAVGADCLGGTCTTMVCQGRAESCVDAVTLTSGANSVAWAAGTNDYLATIPCAPPFATPDGPDIVMSYTATIDGDLTYDITGTGSTEWGVVVSSGTCGTLAPQVSCQADPAFPATSLTDTFEATMGTTYYFYLIDTTSGPNPLANPVSISITETPFPPCRNRVRDGAETDVDCGGGTCAPCGPGLMCSVTADCQFGACTGSLCPAASVTETFEAGPPLASIWATSGTANWSVSTATPINGVYSARSGVITHNEQSNLDLAVTCGAAGGGVIFSFRVDSEANFDFLRFFIDGAPAPGTSTWDGLNVTGRVSFAIPTGAHTLRWQYDKDGSVDRGADAAWIDDVQVVGCTAP